MKSIGGYVIAAGVLAALGAVALGVGRLEHRIAGADEALLSLDFVRSATAYDELEPYVAYARYVPWIGDDALRRIRANRAAVRYWDGDYTALLALARDESARGERTPTCSSSPPMPRTGWDNSARPTVPACCAPSTMRARRTRLS